MLDGLLPAAVLSRERARRLWAEQMGQRIRWLREAYEEQQPGRHSQTQWAEALGITTEMMHRIEHGKSFPWDVLFRIIYRSGACLDYLVWGAPNPDSTLPWLFERLTKAHPELVPIDRFRRERSRDLMKDPIERPERTTKARGPYKARTGRPVPEDDEKP
jgi:hypothetical protein